MKDYYVNIPPTLAEVLADIGHVSADAEFDDIVNAAYASFFAFYTPKKITSAMAQDLEKFVLNYFIMRRVGSGNIRKWRQMFRNKWNSIMPYYERLLETQENETNYFSNPILNVDVIKNQEWTGTKDSQEDTTHNADTEFNTRRVEDETEQATHDTDEEKSKSHSGSDSKTHDENYSKTHSGTDSKSHDETDSKTHSGSFSEQEHETEINRYLDTPQSNANRVWETDSQGNLKLSDYYLTDIRGITNDRTKSGSDQYTESGTDNYTEAGTNSYTETGTDYYGETGTDTYSDAETVDRDESMSTDRDKTTTGTDTTDLDETGQKIYDEDTSHSQTDDALGYEGVSPVDLLLKYRESFLRIYEDIVNELTEVFYNLVEVDDLIDFV